MCRSRDHDRNKKKYLTKIGAATMENNMNFPLKMKIELPRDPAIPLLGIYLKSIQNTNSKRYVHLYVHCIIYNSQDVKST